MSHPAWLHFYFRLGRMHSGIRNSPIQFASAISNFIRMIKTRIVQIKIEEGPIAGAYYSPQIKTTNEL